MDIAEKRLDLAEDSLPVARPGEVRPSRQLHEAGSGDLLRRPTGSLDRDVVLAPVEDERRRGDRRKYVADVDRHVHRLQLTIGGRRGAQALPARDLLQL